MIHQIGQWIEDHIHIPGLPAWASIIILALGMAALSVGITAIALIFIPTDYFTDNHRPIEYRHPIIRWTVRILRNILGWFLIVLGILLSLPGVPGQGVLTILLGVMLAEFPGKRRLELKLIRREKMRAAINRLRARFGRLPLAIDGEVLAQPTQTAPAHMHPDQTVRDHPTSRPHR